MVKKEESASPYATPEKAHETRRKRMRQLLELNAPNAILVNECVILLRSCMDMGVKPASKKSVADLVKRLRKFLEE